MNFSILVLLTIPDPRVAFVLAHLGSVLGSRPSGFLVVESLLARSLRSRASLRLT